MGPGENARKGCTPKHTKLKDLQGRQVHDTLRATTFADYYEQKHWAIEQEDREGISEEPIRPTNTEAEASEITTGTRRSNNKTEKQQSTGTR